MVDTVTLVAAGVAVVFALLAMLQWRRAADLEVKVAELEARLAETAPPPKAILDEEEAEEPEPEPEAEAEAEEEPEPEPEPEPEAEAEEEPEPEAEAEEEPEPEEEAPPIAAEPAPPTEAAEPPPPAPPVRAASPQPDPRRLEALKIVNEAFETCRYLDFDAIVEKPSTYRVTVPMTAANAEAVRYLEEGMFACLRKVMLEDDRAILHVDMSKGRP